MNDVCARCGHTGEDRRTLWMACFYAMNELDVPFEIVKDAPGHPGRFFTLRVCKRCRGDWLAAIESWFHDKPEIPDSDADEPDETGPGSGIFIRERGSIREITREEWDAKNPGREPVVFKPEGHTT